MAILGHPVARPSRSAKPAPNAPGLIRDVPFLSQCCEQADDETD
jgi:hypothetical protein